MSEPISIDKELEKDKPNETRIVAEKIDLDAPVSEENRARIEKLDELSDEPEEEPEVATYSDIEPKSKPQLVKVSSNYRLTIPKDVAESLGIREGDYLRVYQSGNKVVFEKVQI